MKLSIYNFFGNPQDYRLVNFLNAYYTLEPQSGGVGGMVRIIYYWVLYSQIIVCENMIFSLLQIFAFHILLWF